MRTNGTRCRQAYGVCLLAIWLGMPIAAKVTDIEPRPKALCETE